VIFSSIRKQKNIKDNIRSLCNRIDGEVKIIGTLFFTESNFYTDHASFPSSRVSEETKFGAISIVMLREDRELYQKKSDVPRKAEIKGEPCTFYVIRKSREYQNQKENSLRDTNFA